jgi:hypothetical protein
MFASILSLVHHGINDAVEYCGSHMKNKRERKLNE